MVKLDIALVKLLKKGQMNSDILTFEDLFNELFSRLSPMHLIIRKYSDNKEREPPVVKKGKFKPVEFKLESRGGNKKLTVISHLHELLIDAKELQKKIRIEVGCSASVDYSTSVASNIAEEFTITVQGNQINQVSRLLKSIKLCLLNLIKVNFVNNTLGDYGVQAKHIIGLDLGIKE